MSDQALDVAISFLVRDERTAAAVAEQLEGAGLNSEGGSVRSFVCVQASPAPTVEKFRGARAILYWTRR
jgi:hypothetical protein